MCVVLLWLANPSRLHELEELFRKSSSSLSRMFIRDLEHIHTRYTSLLDDLAHQWLTKQEFQRCARATSDRGAPYDWLIAFVDGTVTACCMYAKRFLNGWKKV